jgi:hypothetical protein
MDDLLTENHDCCSDDANDPYLSRTAMPLRGIYYPLGFPLELTTNSKDVMAAAEESWGAFAPRFDVPHIEVRIGVSKSDATDYPSVCTPRAQRYLVTNIGDNENFCINDVRHGFSFGWVTTAAVSHRLYFRHHFLEPAALCHIANRHAAPVHGACVELAGTGVMLCGDSGAGKSSLAFACARAGWTYVTDDACYLLADRMDREIVGNCFLIRLRPSAADLFSEVTDKPLTPWVAGKPSIELQTASLPEMKCAMTANVEHIVYLNRHDGGHELIPFSQAAARRSMHERLTGQDGFREAQVAAVDRLLRANVFELRYSDMDWARDRLERLVREGS